MTQDDLAAAARLGRQFISDLERGETKILVDNLFAIVRVLDIDIRRMFDPPKIKSTRP